LLVVRNQGYGGGQMSNELRIILPWLHKDLSSNSRKHWSQTAKLVASNRAQAKIMTLAELNGACIKTWQEAQAIEVIITFCPPDFRHRDKQNMPANKTLKAYLDGIADALQVDDNKFKPIFMFGDVVKGGEIQIIASQAGGGE
jgi:crossover junction endodeoxyribonuclease RusA